MPLTASDSFQINNITDSLICIISSSDGEALIDLNIPPILICRIFMAGEELDVINSEMSYEYYYLWKRNGNDWRTNIENNEVIPTLGKQLILQLDDLKEIEENAIVFSCEVYEENPILNNAPMVAYGEINLDITIKKWMTFDEETGLWIRKTNSEWLTLTDERGYHIYKTSNPFSNIIDVSSLKWNGSFAEDSLMAPKIRLLYTDNLNEEKHVGRISVIPSTQYGWRWIVSNEGQATELRTLFISPESRQNGTTEINSVAIE